MTRSRCTFISLLVVGSLGALVAIVGCSADRAPTGVSSRSAATGSGGSPLAVTSTSPISSVNDTTLDVHVLGSGYDRGSRADWALSGVVDPTKVKTNRTTFVSSTELVANITISSTAPTAQYDVIVTTSIGKKGIGSELYAITQRVTGNTDTDSRANYVFADHVLVNGSLVSAGIRGDGRNKYGSATDGPTDEYQGRFCGVTAALKYGDLKIDPDAGYPTSSCGAARFYNFYLDGASATVSQTESLARGLDYVAPGQSVIQWEGWGSPISGCAKLVFDDAYPPASSPLQTRLADTTTTNANGQIVIARHWRIESRGSHRAMCMNYANNGTPKPTGTTYFLPFSITVTEIPYPYPNYP